MIKIENKADCCGCTSCVASCHKNAITMVTDEEGFLYPKVNPQKCNNCGFCESACPIIFRNKHAVQTNTIREIYAVRHKDNDKLKKSSSGGAFSALADYVIKQDGCVVGVGYTEDMKVVHSIANTIEGYYQFRGSKYVQSDMSGVFQQIKEILQANRLVLFTGTPCQVEGLKLYLRKEYDNLITVDLICHGVASPLIFRNHIEYLNSYYNDQVVGLSMRDKEDHGWDQIYACKYSFKSGKSITNPKGLTKWSQMYFSNLINRPSCHECRFTNLNRAGDITIADFLDLQNMRKDIMSKEGTSLMLVNSEKGKEVYEKNKEVFHVWPSNLTEAMQPCLKSPVRMPLKRDAFWDYFYTNGYNKTYDKYFKPNWKKSLLSFCRKTPALKHMGHFVKLIYKNLKYSSFCFL